jgi:hypothetical protein
MRDWSPPALRASVHGDAGAVPLSRNDGYLTSDGSAAPDIFIAGLAAQRGVDLLGRAVQPVAQHDDGVVLGVQFSEHYTPVGARESFTGGVATAVKTEVAPPPPSDDIVLAPQEKRNAVRFALHDYVITVYRQGALASQGLKRNLGRSVLDISQSGVQLEVGEALDAGSLVQFTIHLNALSDSLDALAAVRWCRPDQSVAGGSYRCGLQFLNLGDAQRKKIEFMRKWFTKPRRK